MGNIINEDSTPYRHDEFQDDGGTPQWRASHRRVVTRWKVLKFFFGLAVFLFLAPPSLYIFMLEMAYDFNMSPYAACVLFVVLVAGSFWLIRFYQSLPPRR